MKIYIIRHGETDANKMGVMQGGGTDLPLNEMGELLAKETGLGLKKEGIHFDVCYSSNMKRAKRTAELVLEYSDNHCPILYDDRIREIEQGYYEMHKLKGASKEDEAFMNAWMTDSFSVGRFPGGESAQDVCDRTQEFLHELVKKDYQSVFVSTHGAALRAMLNFLYENKKDFWHGMIPYNCCINILEANGDEIKLVEEDKIYYDKKYIVDNYK